MSFKDPRVLFQDILDAAAIIRRYLGDLDYDGYLQNTLVRDGVERRLQVVTEAALRLGSDANILCPGPDWRSIRALGNVLRHAYDSIVNEKVWTVLKQNLPALEQAVREALDRLPPEE